MIVVFGATGNIGSAVVRSLAGRGRAVIAFGRDRGKAEACLPRGTEFRCGDYADPSSVRSGLRDATSLVLVPGDGEARSLLKQNKIIVEAIRQSAIRRVVALSIIDVGASSPFYFAPVYRALETGLSELDLHLTCLRSNIFSEFLASHYLLPAIRLGRLEAPFGDGEVAPIAKKDIADALAMFVLEKADRRETIVLNGPEVFNGQGLSRMASRLAGSHVAYAPLPNTDYLAQLWRSDEDPWPHAFASLARSISENRFGGRHALDDTQKMTGGTELQPILQAALRQLGEAPSDAGK
jgi:NAD(P)H dehydrogenase (quinone)